VAARNNAPVLGAQESPYLQPDHWEFNLGFRYQYSFRHFVGDQEQKQRTRALSTVKNKIETFNLTWTYGWSDQTTVSITVPYQMAWRSSSNSTFVGEQKVVHAQGIGDTIVMAHRWLFDTHECLDGNVGVGLGIKMPTGQDNVQDSVKSKDSAGKTVLVSSTVDQSIQPGDGGWGVAVDLAAYKRCETSFGNFTPYAYGYYLFQPEQYSGVQTGRGGAGEGVMSIPDQYLARAGTMMDVPWVEGMSAGLGLRIEGIPVRDVFGADRGFRRPGYAISWEPQLNYASGRDVFAISIPYAWIRNRQRSVADQQFGGHGDAAFADWVLLLSWTRRF
jgi:hypothetical protein